MAGASSRPMRRRGMSLVELMIATAVGVIVLGMASTFLITSTRVSTRSLTRVTLEEEATLAMDRLVADIEQTVLMGISTYPTDGTTAPVLISILPIETPLPDGRQRFGTHPIVYQWDGATFTRRIVDANSLNIKISETTPINFPGTVLAQMVNLPGTQQQVLETGVTFFRVTQTGNAFTLTLHAERHANTGNVAPEAFTVNRCVALRNL
ncbi:MAG: PilW family protein [Candidatus Xenobia bacterium]